MSFQLMAFAAAGVALLAYCIYRIVHSLGEAEERNRNDAKNDSALQALGTRTIADSVKRARNRRDARHARRLRNAKRARSRRK